MDTSPHSPSSIDVKQDVGQFEIQSGNVSARPPSFCRLAARVHDAKIKDGDAVCIRLILRNARDATISRHKFHQH
jgi:hypothetical protein